MKTIDSLTILKCDVAKLHQTVDSLQNSLAFHELQFKMNEQQNIIAQVEGFYESAWLKLIIVITILGVLIPLIAQYLQRQNLKDLTDFILKQVNTGFEHKLKELREYNEQKIAEETKNYRQDLENLKKENEYTLLELDGSTFYLQGRSLLIDKNYKNAARDFLKATSIWLNSRRPDRSKACLTNFLISIRNLPTRAEFDKFNQSLEVDCFTQLADIKANPNSNFVEAKINEIEEFIAQLK